MTIDIAALQETLASVDAERGETGINGPECLDSLLTDIGNQLGLNRPLPLLESLASQETGLTFMGARQLVINGMTIAQLVYKDQHDELLAFCKRCSEVAFIGSL